MRAGRSCSASASTPSPLTALVTRTSIGPSCRSTVSIAFSAASLETRSAATVTTEGMTARAADRFASERDAIATFAPSATKALAQASPIPLLPPVTKTFLPASPRSIPSGLSGLRECGHLVISSSGHLHH